MEFVTIGDQPKHNRAVGIVMQSNQAHPSSLPAALASRKRDLSLLVLYYSPRARIDCAWLTATDQEIVGATLCNRMAPGSETC
jgi:hypothetical protein